MNRTHGRYGVYRLHETLNELKTDTQASQVNSGPSVRIREFHVHDIASRSAVQASTLVVWRRWKLGVGRRIVAVVAD